MKFFRNHKIITFLMIIFIVLLGILGGKKILEGQRADKNLLCGLEVEDYGTYIESLSETPSDIEGMSLLDKYQMGMSLENGSDSDYDGLTDKEEIEIYGSDPLNASTSGDLYTDGYKVLHDMHLNTLYEYKEAEEFAYNECSNIQLSASNALDFNAVVKDYTDRYSLSDFGINKVYQGYWLYNYSGSLSIDLSGILYNANITLNDIDIWIYKGDFLVYGLSNMERCKYTSNGEVVTLSYDFDNAQSYYVYVTEKTTMLDSVFASQTNGLQLNESKDKEVAFLAVGSPILSNIKVYYPERESEEEETELLGRAKTIFGDEVEYCPLGIDKIKKKYSSYQNIIPSLETKDGVVNDNWALALFGYQYYEDDTSMTADTDSTNSENVDRVEYNNYHTEFDPYIDELPFQNFESEYSTGGNCAGISYLTAYLFNTGSFPDAGEYNGVAWNISDDQENATLVDKGLYDYKTKDFIDNNSSYTDNYIGEGLTAGESEFVKMIGACWKETNDNIPSLNEKMISNEWKSKCRV